MKPRVLRRESAWLIFAMMLWPFCTGLSAQTPFSRYFKEERREMLVMPRAQLPAADADGKVQLTERQAVETALVNNFDINLQRQQVVGEREHIEQLRGFYDPRATFQFGWDRERTPTASVLQGGASVTNILTSMTSAYAQTWSTGTSMEASFGGARNRTTNFFSSLVPAINTQLEVQFRQNLLRGFGRVDQEYRIEIARNAVQTEEQEFKRRAMDLILQVQDRYWELEYGQRDIEVKDKSLQLAKTILEQNRARLSVGTAARLEVIQTESEVALRQEELIRARYNHRLVQDQLVRLISQLEDPRQFPGEVVPADSVAVPPDVEESFEQLKTVAYDNRPEIEQAKLDSASQRVSVNLTRDHLRPNLDLVAGYQQFGLGGNFVNRDFSQGFLDPPLIGITPGGLRQSLDQLVTADYYGYMLGFTLQLPVFNQEARAENAQAQIALNAAQVRERNVRQQIALQLREALTRIEMNRASLEAGEAAVRSAHERIVGEQARFEAGMATTREMIEAQRDLLLAETTALRARIDLIKSHALLDNAAGRTFERFNIRLVEALRTNIR
jgi:outer membrane protein